LLLSIRQGHGYRPLTRIQIVVGLGDRAPHLFHRPVPGIARKIRSDEAPVAVRHVALRAFGLAKEKAFAALWITGKLLSRGSTLQTAQMTTADHQFLAALGEVTRPNVLEVTVKRNPDGVVSNAIHTLQTGDMLTIRGPQGSFVFDADNKATFRPQRQGVSVKVVLACAPKG
jgi:hypothetical protein